MHAFVCLIAFLIATSLVVILRPVAPLWGLLDRPGGRKTHDGIVPVVGGIAIFGGVCVGALVSSQSSALTTVIAISALLVLVGLIDDCRGLSSYEKLAAQIIAAFHMAIVADVNIHDLGLLSTTKILLHDEAAIALTMFCVVGLVNAVNMIDGMDGLAGSVTTVALCFFAVAAFAADATADLQLALLTISAVLGFLVFNVRTRGRRARTFMGDAGSLLLGFILAWLSVSLSQGEEHAVTPIAAVWIVGVPLLDALAVMLRRILLGRSPFAADRGHLHHILLDWGLSVNQTLAAIIGLGIMFGTIGLASVYFEIPEKLMLIAALSIFSIYFSMTILAKRSISRQRAMSMSSQA